VCWEVHLETYHHSACLDFSEHAKKAMARHVHRGLSRGCDVEADKAHETQSAFRERH
jgi:hypothetical protein